MKFRGLAGYLSIGTLFMTLNVWAADKTLSSLEQSPEAAPVGQKVEPPKVDPKVVAKIREKVEERKKEINSTEWDITLGTHDPKAKGGPQKLSFQNDMVSIASFQKRGFGPTNYTVSVPNPDSDGAVFETMQVGTEGIVFIRGEWKDKNMQGVINEQLDGGKILHEYWFISENKTGLSAASSADKTGSSPVESVKSEEPSALVVKEQTTSATGDGDIEPSTPTTTVDELVNKVTDKVADKVSKTKADDSRSGNRGWF